MLIAAETGFSIGDEYVAGILFAGIALFAAVGALSQRGQRAFTAAIVYVAVAVGTGVLAPGDVEKVYWTVIACAVVSIVLHGLSALPFTRRLRL